MESILKGKDGKKHTELKIYCPRAKRFGKQGECPDDLYSWIFKSCKNQVFIDVDGYCFCKECENHRCFVMDLRFKCNSERHTSDYINYDPTDMTSAIGNVLDGLNASDINY